MKTYTLSFGASIDHKPEHPERTARKPQGWDVRYQVWPNRASMAKSIRMQQRRAPHPSDWKAVQSLTDGEGY
jgi:hypothetical protein